MKMSIKILQGNCLETLSSLEEKSVNTCVTSPPYWGLRDYGNGDQLGQEETPEKFVESLVNVFREVRRVLRDDGTVWLNLGDSYIVGGQHKPNKECLKKRQKGVMGVKAIKVKGLKPKDLIGIPWRVAFALQADGWYLAPGYHLAASQTQCQKVSQTDAPKHMSIFFCLVNHLNIITTMKLLRKTARNLQKIV
jgi:hypothetical protein